MNNLVPRLLINPINKFDEITDFYNKNFPNSPHRKKYKQEMYNNQLRNPIYLVLILKASIIGLLESWNEKNNPKVKILVTILIDPEHRRKGYALRLYEKAVKLIKQDHSINKIVVHFRDSNKKTLIPFYKKRGFSNLENVGSYKNKPEIEWGMSIILDKSIQK